MSQKQLSDYCDTYFMDSYNIKDIRLKIASDTTNNICGTCVSSLYKNETDENIQHLFEVEYRYKLMLSETRDWKEAICHNSKKIYSENDNIKDIRLICAEEANKEKNICGSCVARLYKNIDLSKKQ